MSESCFGFQALFSQDSRRRSKIPMATPVRVTSDQFFLDFQIDLTSYHFWEYVLWNLRRFFKMASKKLEVATYFFSSVQYLWLLACSCV